MTKFPQASTTEYVIAVIPIGNGSPGWKVDVSVYTPVSSDAVGGVHVTAAVGELASVVWLMLGGMSEMTGYSVSADQKIKY